MKKFLFPLLIAAAAIGPKADAQPRKPFEGTMTTKVSYYIQTGAAGAGTQIIIQKIKGTKSYAVTKADTKAEFSRALYDFTDPQNGTAYGVLKLASGDYAALKIVFPYDKATMEPVVRLMAAEPAEVIEKFGMKWEKKSYTDDARTLDGYISTDYYQASGSYELPISYTLLSDMKLDGAAYTSSTTELLDIRPEPVPDELLELPANTRVFDNVKDWTNYVLKENNTFRKKNPEAYKQYETIQNRYAAEFEKMSKSEETVLPDNLWDF